MKRNAYVLITLAAAMTRMRRREPICGADAEYFCFAAHDRVSDSGSK